MFRSAHPGGHGVSRLIAAAALLVASCKDVSVTAVAADHIDINPAAAELRVDESVQFTARVLSEQGHLLSGRSVEWTSLDAEIAVVDDNGTVRAVAPGTALIRAASEGASNSATVAVTAALTSILAAEPQTLSFSGPKDGATPLNQTVSITNAGTGNVTGISVAVRYGSGQSTDWLSASLSSNRAPTTLVVSVNLNGLAPGTYAATIDISAPGIATPASVSVALSVVAAPTAPSNLTATPVSWSQIDLTWKASTGSVESYRIQRKMSHGGDYVLIDSVSGGTTTYKNSGLLPATRYTYRVEACGAGGCSNWSNQAAATTALFPGYTAAISVSTAPSPN